MKNNDVRIMSNIDLKTIVNKIGREAYISIFYPEIKANSDITSSEISLKYRDRKYTDKSWNSRTSKSKRLFSDGLEKEALKYIIDSSKKLEANIVHKAELYIREE